VYISNRPGAFGESGSLALVSVLVTRSMVRACRRGPAPAYSVGW
jgi:hypothetical protein